MKQFLVVVLFIGGLNAADDKPPPELSAAVRPLLELTRTGPPEILAETIVRLVEGGKIPPIERQRALLVEAFSAAQRAQEPMRPLALPGVPSDPRALYRSRAGELELDSLSLERRILRALLTVDRPKARELFERTQRPALQPEPCEAALIPDAAAYYEIAAQISQGAYTAAEKEKEHHVTFLATVLSGARTPGELAAFVRSLESVDLKPPQLELLVSSVAARLEALGPYYRGFALSFDRRKEWLESLAARARGGSGAALLSRGMRRYLVTQLTAPPCSEVVGETGAVQWFNTQFKGDAEGIKDEDVRPAKSGGAYHAQA